MSAHPTPANSAPAFESVYVAPAARVWTEPMPDTVEGKAAFFQEHGFVIIRNVLNAAELAELDRELSRLAEHHRSLPQIREGFSMEPKQDATRKTPTFRKIGGIGDLSEAFAGLMRHPRILEVAHAVMGDTIWLWRDVVMMKPARVGREKPWHQDSSYWPWQPMQLVSAMTALDDASPENGCLQIIPGTHQQEIKHYGQELRIDLTPQQQAQTWYAPLKAGDCILFHSLLLHASEPNTSNQDRRVCIFSYRPEGLKFIGKGEERDAPLVSRR